MIDLARSTQTNRHRYPGQPPPWHIVENTPGVSGQAKTLCQKRIDPTTWQQRAVPAWDTVRDFTTAEDGDLVLCKGCIARLRYARQSNKTIHRITSQVGEDTYVAAS